MGAAYAAGSGEPCIGELQAAAVDWIGGVSDYVKIDLKYQAADFISESYTIQAGFYIKVRDRNATSEFKHRLTKEKQAKHSNQSSLRKS